jgi:hypothetical protein
MGPAIRASDFYITKRVMLLYNNVARLRHFLGVWRPQSGRRSADLAAARPIDLNFEVADFLAQRITINTEEIGGADLIASRGRKRRRQKRRLHFPQNAVIQAGRR